VKLAVLIMAAGKGTRLKSRRPKVLHEIGGKPLLGHVIAAARKLVEATDIFVVVGHQAERVEQALAATGVHFVLQAEQRGTGHAVQCALHALAGYDHALVLSGDVPLIRPETIAALRDFHLAQKASMTVLTAAPQNPFGYGRVARRAIGSPEVTAILEQKALTAEQQSLPEINSGIYAFAVPALTKEINKLSTNNAHGEYYLTDMAALLVAAGDRVVAIEAADAAEVLGANTLAELVALDRTMRLNKANALMAEGVTIFAPETSRIDAEVEVGADTILEPFVQLLGHTKVGSDCTIRSYSVLENVIVGDGVQIKHACILADSTVAAGAKIGPFSHLRPGSEVGEEAHVGNFVELKKTRLGKRAKANHLAYLGDSEIGAGTNIAAGVITCNYDGEKKHRTTIGEGVFVGSDSTLVAPITIGDGSYIGAGSCITENVPAEALAIGRAHQTTKPGWIKKRREDREQAKIGKES
jgi:bifunctional UDP-N-acetylglucosamine pyrophosphorylase/glucosamine-1-phosphate N-acetyltransferase